MTKPKEVQIKDKKAYLEEHSPLCVDFEEVRFCICCERLIKVKDYKVLTFGRDTFPYICCPNAPDDCDGSILDWMKPTESDFEDYTL